MKKLTVAQQKGGVGKTNTLFHLAHYFSDQGKKVAVIDIDTQANLSWSLEHYKQATYTAYDFFVGDININNITSEENIVLFEAIPELLNLEAESLSVVGEQFKKNVDALSSKFDICLIDTAPALGVRLTSALYAADFTYTPIEMAGYSVNGLNMMIQTIENLKSANPTLSFIGVIPSRFNGRHKTQVQNLEDLRKNTDLLAPIKITERVAIADAAFYKQPVWKLKKGARDAIKEMREFGKFIESKMEL
ncbi:ParA family protein [Pseudoalteromonas sp. SSM20]|uniref:ParA family protein n=1 Tax=Pseudoalteromonas sp. SSM20 TaxID=3139394 RepID=UPI003BAB3DC4